MNASNFFLLFIASHFIIFRMSKPMKKSTHGGKRPGAGRKPIGGEKVMVAARLPKKLVEKLDRFAKANGLTRSHALAEAIHKLK